MANIQNLGAAMRDTYGKGFARRMRGDGRVPATLYGDTKDPQSISISHNEFVRIYKTGRILSTLLDLDIDGKKQRAIARDIQLHPVSDAVLHIDFLRLGAGAKIAVEVPVRFINEDECPGLRTGGVLNVVRYTVELNCPADNIPDDIVIDLEGLNLGDSVHISDTDLPDGVSPVISDRDFTIATIASPAGLKTEEEEAQEGETSEEGETGEGETGAEEDNSE